MLYFLKVLCHALSWFHVIVNGFCYSHFFLQCYDSIVMPLIGFVLILCRFFLNVIPIHGNVILLLRPLNCCYAFFGVTCYGVKWFRYTKVDDLLGWPVIFDQTLHPWYHLNRSIGWYSVPFCLKDTFGVPIRIWNI